MGGCVGVSCLMAFAVAYPKATMSLLNVDHEISR